MQPIWIFERLKFGKGNLSGIRLRILIYNQTKKRKSTDAKPGSSLREALWRRSPEFTKKQKKLPRWERIAKLTASRFSSAITEKRAEHSERSRINEKKRSSCRNRGETPAARCSFRAAEQKTRQKATGILYTWRIGREGGRKSSSSRRIGPT